MTILFVAMMDSIHTARWIKQLDGTNHEIHIFPSTTGNKIHPFISGQQITSHVPWVFKLPNAKFRYFFKAIILLCSVPLKLLCRFSSEDRLRRVIKKLRPDLIHSLETQHAGYLVNDVKSKWNGAFEFPKWLHTNWGSDIYLFGRLREHKKKVKEVLGHCDYYSCESDRDIILAKECGFKGITFSPFPNAGGFDISFLHSLNSIRTSKRRKIMLKGYQGWAGRALVAIKALELAKDALHGYTVNIFSNPNNIDIAIAAELLAQNAGISVNILPYIDNHGAMLKLFSEARLYIGLSISDAISTSLLEAMATGAFPIQSDTSTAVEWLTNGIDGFVVPPEEPIYISRKIITALTDDSLVDSAADRNWDTICKRADSKMLKEKTIQMYSEILRNLTLE